MLSVNRLVRKDGTLIFSGRYYETDFALCGQKVEVRRRLTEPERLYVYHDGRYVGIGRPLNRTLNSKLPRNKTNPAI